MDPTVKVEPVDQFEGCEILSDDYPNYDIAFKVIVIGNSGVGKSCLSNQATKHAFETNYLATVGFEFFSFNVKMDDKIVKLQIWDTCGQEIYRSLIKNFYRNSSLAVIVYAIDDEKSFKDIDGWIKDLKANASSDVKIFLIGNKADLEDHRKVSKEEAKKYKEDILADEFMETSAKTGFNAQLLFYTAAKLLYKESLEFSKKKPKKLEENKKLDKKKHEAPPKKGCC